MTCRAFFFLSLLSMTSNEAKVTTHLLLRGQVFPQISVNVINPSNSGNYSPGFEIQTNMKKGTYKIFVHNAPKNPKGKETVSYRRLVVEAN